MSIMKPYSNLNSSPVYQSGLCAVYVWRHFDNSLEFGVRICWMWASVYAGNVVWAGESDSEWQAIADALFRFGCVAGFAGDGVSNPIWLYRDIVDAGLADPCA